MTLTVRHRLFLLLFGSLSATLLMAALALAVLIDIQDERQSTLAAHATLENISGRLLVIEHEAGRHAADVASRPGIAARYANLFGGGKLAGDALMEERWHLMHDLSLLAEGVADSAITAYDASGRIVPLAAPEDAQKPKTIRGKATAPGTQEHRLQHPDHEDLGQKKPGGASVAFVPPGRIPVFADSPMTQIRRLGRELQFETVVPVRHFGEAGIRTVGWLLLTRPFPLVDLIELADAYRIEIGLLLSGDFDAANPYRLKPIDLALAPSFRDTQAHAHSEDDAASNEAFFLDAVRLPLTDGEQAWLIAAIPHQTINDEQRSTLLIVIGTLAASLLVSWPVTHWLSRRWIVKPLEDVRAGVHAYTSGNLAVRIDDHAPDEIGSLAKDFNALATALQSRQAILKQAEERWRAMIEAIEGSGIGLYIIDADYRLRYSSRGTRALLDNIGDDTPIPCHLAIFGQSEPCDFCPLERVIRGETAHLQTLAVDGQYYDLTAMPLGAEGGQRSLLALVSDVSERAAAQQLQREAAAVFEATAEAIMVTDDTGTIKRVNSAFTTITGYTAEEAVGKTPRILKSGRHDKPHYEKMWSSLQATGHWAGEVWNRRKSGEIFPIWQNISSIRNAQGVVTEYVSLFYDITNRKRSEAEVIYRANYDALTDLPNRNLLTERLGQALKAARREKARLALMFIDLDRFKPVNDRFGHAVGDHLLQKVAEQLRQCVRETDTVSRQGGDEFVVLLPEVQDAAATAAVAEKIIGQLSSPVEIDGHEIRIGASIGIAMYPDNGDDIDTLFKHADLAMYHAKATGRNNARFFTAELAAPAANGPAGTG